ncbi:MAG: hypothetical protein WC853_08295 [Thermodesulfovibrionales bacterium]
MKRTCGATNPLQSWVKKMLQAYKSLKNMVELTRPESGRPLECILLKMVELIGIEPTTS